MTTIKRFQRVFGMTVTCMVLACVSGGAQADRFPDCPEDPVLKDDDLTLWLHYCYVPASCPDLTDKIMVIAQTLYVRDPQLGTMTKEQVLQNQKDRAEATAIADRACKACTSGGKPRCTIIP